MKSKFIFLMVLFSVFAVHYFLLSNTGSNIIQANQVQLNTINKKVSKEPRKRQIKLRDLSFKSSPVISNYKDKALKDHIYCLPFKPGNSYVVSQTVGRTHKNNGKYAIDFMIPTGAGIHAARSGKVIATQDLFTHSGRTEEYLGSANYIVIEHVDGTIAMYAHLDKNGVRVSKGEYVNVGDHIGYSGNTGFSNGAHLHFEVFANKKGRSRSVPLYFWTKNSLREKLEAGKRYFASKDCLQSNNGI